MAKAKFPNLVLTGFAAILATGAGLVHAAAVDPKPAYAAPARNVEASTIAQTAKSLFVRADLDNDDTLSEDEYVTLSIVTAELARLNGFVPVDYEGGVRTATLMNADAWTSASRHRVAESALRDYSLFAGEDGRLSKDEFISARMEALSAADSDRNGVLAGHELHRFAAIEARVSGRRS